MRIVVVGTSGSGKTTLAKKLSATLAIPYIELDLLFWESGWVAADNNVFQDRVKEAIDQPSWVACGNYKNTVRELVWSSADVVIWLDYSLLKTLRRAIKRTVRNWLHRQEAFPGCDISLVRELIPVHNGLIHWILHSYRRHKKEYLSFGDTNPYNGNPLIVIRNEEEKSSCIQKLYLLCKK